MKKTEFNKKCRTCQIFKAKKSIKRKQNYGNELFSKILFFY